MPNPRFRRDNKKHPFKPRFKGKSQFSQSSKEYQHHNQLQETDVGITQFICNLEGFSGIIKARFSDFQVNEIDLNGEIAKLTSQEIPKFDETNSEETKEVPNDSPLSKIPQEKWSAIKEMIESKDNDKFVEIDATELSKEDRGLIHEITQKYFGHKLTGSTVTEGGVKKMIFKKFKGKNDDNRSKWPKHIGEFVHFLVYKESMDTLDTTLKLASSLKMLASSFTYAGVKDKRAKTTQWFSVKKVEPWKLIIKTKSLRNVRIGNITFKDEPLKLGDLSGNQFRVALRNVTGNDELIEKSLQSLKEKGFINYFGLQRFGNDKAVPTFSIGVQLLLGNWKEACQIILKPTESDQPNFDITKAKKVYFETGEASKALEQISESKTSVEYLLLSGLSKGHSNDYVNALSSIPRNTRLLYLHSFQSLVWNVVASKRIENFGLEVVEGDLVRDSEATEEVKDDVAGNIANFKRPKVKILTKDDLSRYSVYDVVLPLPGYDVIYPENLKDFYKEILESYGLSLEMTKQKVKDYTLSGTYRKLLGQVQNLSWKIMYYNDPNYNLIRSDLEELKGFDEPKSVEGGAYKALILEFSLDSSCYATMVLREILKTDTSSGSHAKLNNYHVKNQEKMKTRIEETKDDEEENTDKIGLLNDLQKYEDFKSLVFGDDDKATLKRKHEEDKQETIIGKIVKIDEQMS